MNLLTSYTFWVVAIGTMLLASTSGAIGCITVLKGQSLIGDAIGHSTFPGIVIAFMILLRKDSFIFLIGAIISSIVAFICIQMFSSKSKLNLDAVLAIVLSSFFGLGMVLISHIQGNSNYANAAQAGIQKYIFGQSAYMLKSDVYMIFFVCVPSILLLLLFYKEIKVFIFDETLSKMSGIPNTLMYLIMLIMCMGLISTGLKAVGSILIASFFIAPAITALQWSKRFHIVLIISSIVGALSSFIGTYFSTLIRGLSTGPAIIIVMTMFALISLLIGPHGIIANFKQRKRNLG